jgi:hypothetical protein
MGLLLLAMSQSRMFATWVLLRNIHYVFVVAVVAVCCDF